MIKLMCWIHCDSCDKATAGTVDVHEFRGGLIFADKPDAPIGWETTRERGYGGPRNILLCDECIARRVGG